MLLVGWQEGHPACKKTKWWGAGVVICLERVADVHMAQLMPLPLTVSCFSKNPDWFYLLVPAHPGSPGQRAVKRVRVCVCVPFQTHTHSLLFGISDGLLCRLQSVQNAAVCLDTGTHWCDRCDQGNSRPGPARED